jgi:hypothetical protein
MKRATRDEAGNSMIMGVLIMMVATGLVTAVLVTVEQGMRVSRRNGDSANALQLADAAVNDAVKAVATTNGTSIPLQTKTLGGAGQYTYTASLDPAKTLWHIDAYGLDNTGVKRHVKADAVPESLFSNAFFVNSGIQLPSGISLDSFTSGATVQDTCTRKGVLGTNDGAHLTFQNNSNSTPQVNCTNNVWYGGLSQSQGGWGFPVDGCVAYFDENKPQSLPPGTGTSPNCPPVPYSRTTAPKYSIPSVTPPDQTGCANNTSPAPWQCFKTQQSGAGTSAQSWPNVPCDATHPIPGGKRWFVSQLSLLPGCYVDATNGPALVYTTGAVNIGLQGNSNTNKTVGMNKPPMSNTLLCPAAGNGVDATQNQNPLGYYCPGWSGNLQIYMTDTDSGPISFGNTASFWGVIYGQSAQISTAPNVEVWGALRVAGLNAQSGITLHYDEALGNIVTGIYRAQNWREEPVSG